MSDIAAYQAARAICRRHAKSFYFASRFLPQPKRSHAYAVYVFCRLLDDAVDETDDPVVMEKQIARFLSILDDAYSGKMPSDDDEASLALRAFGKTIHQCAIPQQYFVELAEGCRMDLTINRYPDWPALERYCYHVAGVVGLIMCRVFDLNDHAAHRQAVAMGNAMQLTNILRDIREDFDRSRIYLPADEMAQFGVTEDDLKNHRVTPDFKALMRFQIARSRALYADGFDGLRYLAHDGSRQTAAVMARVYSGILGAIEKLDYNVFHQRAHLNIFQKLILVPRALREIRP